MNQEIEQLKAQLATAEAALTGAGWTRNEGCAWKPPVNQYATRFHQAEQRAEAAEASLALSREAVLTLSARLESEDAKREAAEARVRELEGLLDSANYTLAHAQQSSRDHQDARGEAEARLAAVLRAIPFPALSAGTAESLAYPLEQTGTFGQVTNEAAAAWLRDIAAKLKALDAARTGDAAHPDSVKPHFYSFNDDEGA